MCFHCICDVTTLPLPCVSTAFVAPRHCLSLLSSGSAEERAAARATLDKFVQRQRERHRLCAHIPGPTQSIYHPASLSSVRAGGQAGVLILVFGRAQSLAGRCPFQPLVGFVSSVVGAECDCATAMVCELQSAVYSNPTIYLCTSTALSNCSRCRSILRHITFLSPDMSAPTHKAVNMAVAAGSAPIISSSTSTLLCDHRRLCSTVHPMLPRSN